MAIQILVVASRHWTIVNEYNTDFQTLIRGDLSGELTRRVIAEEKSSQLHGCEICCEG
jgi:hypothetical protein